MRKFKFLEKIISFLKKVFVVNEKQIKLPDKEKVEAKTNEREEFIKKIKVKLNSSANNENTMKTHISVGDGLGLKNKITRLIC